MMAAEGRGGMAMVQRLAVDQAFAGLGNERMQTSLREGYSGNSDENAKTLSASPKNRPLPMSLCQLKEMVVVPRPQQPACHDCLGG